MLFRSYSLEHVYADEISELKVALDEEQETRVSLEENSNLLRSLIMKSFLNSLRSVTMLILNTKCLKRKRLSLVLDMLNLLRT